MAKQNLQSSYKLIRKISPEGEQAKYTKRLNTNVH